jgi:Tfp pilus assembly protein PilZ
MAHEEHLMIERRKESRLIEKNHVQIRSLSDADGGQVINAYTHDISTGGARIQSTQRFCVGTAVHLEVRLARTKQSIALEAEVKWCRENRIENMFELGVEFRHRMTSTLVTLIRHLYSPEERIPSMIA